MKKHNIPQKVVEVLKDIGETSQTATWDCHGTVVILHKALEKVAAHKGITFDAPVVVESCVEKKMVVMVVTGRLGEKVEWSFGEAAPYNLKNSYPFAMAEKRAKDRVILKLVGLHGDAYSEEEAEDFKDSKPTYTAVEPEDFKDSKPTDTAVEPVSVVSDEARAIWNQALDESDSLSLSALCALISHEAETELNASFLPGEVSHGKKRVKELCSQGFKEWEKLADEVSGMLEEKDASGLLEAVSELFVHEKKHLSSLLGELKSKTLKDLIAAQNQAIGGN